MRYLIGKSFFIKATVFSRHSGSLAVEPPDRLATLCSPEPVLSPYPDLKIMGIVNQSMEHMESSP